MKKVKLTPLYDTKKGKMFVVGLMSGSGTNLEKIIEFERANDAAPFSYKVVAIFSDTYDCNAAAIGKKYDLPVVIRDINGFHAARGEKKKNLLKLKEAHEKNPNDLALKQEYEKHLKLRQAFDIQTVNALAPFGADVAAHAGYMSIATAPLIKAFLGINVHPADLSIKNRDGSRKYTGDNAVRDAILAGEQYIRSTTHIIEEKVDYGRILMISPPLEIVLPTPTNFDENDDELVKKISKEHQDKLKEVGDWVIFPKTLENIALGNYMKDERGNLYFRYSEKNIRPISDGVKLAR